MTYGLSTSAFIEDGPEVQAMRTRSSYSTARSWRALTAERPRTFYPVLRQRLLNWTIPLALPARLLDRLIAKRLGIGPP